MRAGGSRGRGTNRRQLQLQDEAMEDRMVHAKVDMTVDGKFVELNFPHSHVVSVLFCFIANLFE